LNVEVDSFFWGVLCLCCVGNDCDVELTNY
jgi:hypothetical protein